MTELQEKLLREITHGVVKDSIIELLTDLHTKTQRECDAKQAKIDELMIEYCPDAITDEQWAEYQKHQVPVSEDLLEEIMEGHRLWNNFMANAVTYDPPYKWDGVIRPEDFKIEIYYPAEFPRTERGVRITHIPTKIVVQESGRRSQHANRYYAHEQMRELLHEHPDYTGKDIAFDGRESKSTFTFKDIQAAVEQGRQSVLIDLVDLTDDEILAIAIQYDAEEGISDVEYGKRVITAFKDKNK